MTIGEKIHDLRIKHNMTMDDLARELGVQRSAINKYEKGIVVNLKRSTISSLCRVFNVSSSYFLDDGEPPEQIYQPVVPVTTEEARIISGGIDRMPKERREQALKILQVAFSEYADYFKEEHHDDT